MTSMLNTDNTPALYITKQARIPLQALMDSSLRQLAGIPQSVTWSAVKTSMNEGEMLEVSWTEKAHHVPAKVYRNMPAQQDDAIGEK